MGVQEKRKRSMLAQVRSVRRVSQQLVMCALLPNLRDCFRGEGRKLAAIAVWNRARAFAYQYPLWNLLQLGFAIADCFSDQSANCFKMVAPAWRVTPELQHLTMVIAAFGQFPAEFSCGRGSELIAAPAPLYKNITDTIDSIKRCNEIILRYPSGYSAFL